jgi:uncharacterized protein (DUF433 family)
VNQVPLNQPNGHSASAALDWRSHVVVDPGVLGGKPSIKGTRLVIEFVLELMAGGWSDQAIFKNYANLTKESLRAVLAHAAQTLRDDRFHLLPPLAPAP